MTKDEALNLAFAWYGSGNQDPDEFEKLILSIVAQPEHIGFMDSKLNPIQRTWVGLTDGERNKLWRDVIKWGDPSHDDVDLMKAIEAKLKEKNT
jgi:hypothetical protein